MVNTKRLVSLAQKLIRINSENPPGKERALAIFVKAQLRKLGLHVKLYEFQKGRTNVVGTLPGRTGQKTLLLTPHLDTVPAGGNWSVAPFSGVIQNGKLYGRGATDCKSNLACGIEALTSIVEDGVPLTYTLVFAATADEETGSGAGLIPLIEKDIIRPDAAVVLDADDHAIVIAQKGLIHCTISIAGKKAHGAYPDRGVNAIEAAAKVIRDLKAYRFPHAGFQFLKPPTINIGTISGGDKVNMVADWCDFQVDIRFLPGMSASDVMRQVHRVVRRSAREYRIDIQDVQQPFSIDKRHFLVNNLACALKDVGLAVRIKGSEGATVITFFQRKDIPAVATGCGTGGTAHATDEYVTLKNLIQGARFFTRLIERFSFPEVPKR
jgi:succinyl-diaminopimelate desuccinylase